MEFIDGLRGIAVLIVVLGHYYVGAYELGLPRWADIFGLGYLGVHLFLLLSGFCVSWAYVAGKNRPFSLADFASRRALRILPAYYAALLIATLLSASSYSGRALAWQVSTHALMLHNFFPDTVLGLDPPFWSLALECQLYVCFPFMLLGLRRFGLAITLAIVLLIQVVFRVFVMRYGTGYTNTTFVLPWSVAGRLSEFALGMAAAIGVSRATLAWFPSSLRVLLSPLVLLVFAAALWCKGHLGVIHPLTDLLWSVGFLGFMLAASQRGTRLNRIVSGRWLVSLGIFSYSVYLVHELVLTRIMARALVEPQFRAHPLLAMPLVLAPTLGAGYLFYRFVERPAIEYFSRRRRQRAGVPASASS